MTGEACPSINEYFNQLLYNGDMRINYSRLGTLSICVVTLCLSTIAQQDSPTNPQPPVRDWVDYSLLAVQMITAVGLLVTIGLSIRSIGISQTALEEMKGTREQEIEPYMAAYFDVVMDNKLGGVVYFVIKNEGRTAARNVKLEFDPTLPAVQGNKNLAELNMIKDGIPVIPPNFSIRARFHFLTVIMKHGTQYRLKMTYQGLHNRTKCDEYNLDLKPFEDLIFENAVGLGEVVDQLQVIGKNTEKLQDKFDFVARRIDNGLWLQNSPNRLKNISIEDWKNVIKARLMEYEVLWTRIYGARIDNLNDDLFFSEMRNAFSRIGKDLIFYVASAPAGISNSAKEQIIALSEKLCGIDDPVYVIDERSREDFDFTELANDILRTLKLTSTFGISHSSELEAN